MNTIPNLDNFVSNAFNLKNGNFLGNAIFKISFDSNQTQEWNGEDRQVPDQIDTGIGTSYDATTESLYLKEKSDVKNHFSSDVKASFSGVVYSGSVKASFMTQGSLLQDTESYYNVKSYMNNILTFNRVRHDLMPGFIADSNGLPLTIDTKNNKKDYFDYFDKYGTHYINGGSLGGRISLITTIKKSFYEKTDKKELSSEIEGSYEGALVSGSASAKIEIGSSSYFSNNKNEVKIDLSVKGGVFAEGETKLTEWISSCYKTPDLIYAPDKKEYPDLELIAELLVDHRTPKDLAQIKKNMIDLMQEYVLGTEVDDTILSYSSTDIDFEQLYTDEDLKEGFVIASIDGVRGGGRYNNIQIKNDDDYSPNTLRMMASHCYFTSFDSTLGSLSIGGFSLPPTVQSWVPYASFTMPKPADTKFLLETGKRGPQNANPKSSQKMVSFRGLEENGLKAWEPREVNTEYEAQTDGFLVANVDYNKYDGARGYVLGQIKDNNGTYTSLWSLAIAFILFIPSHRFSLVLHMDYFQFLPTKPLARILG